MDADVAGGGIEWWAVEFNCCALLRITGWGDGANGYEFFAVAGEGELNFDGEVDAEALVAQEAGADFFDVGLLAEIDGGDDVRA